MVLKHASMMLCNAPARVDGRYAMSASDGIWEPLGPLPLWVQEHFLDDVGGYPPKYAGALQPKNASSLVVAEEKGTFICLRSVRSEDFPLTDTVPATEVYESYKSSLELVGWDVCTGNGWASASYEGEFPLYPLTGEVTSNNVGELNQYSLFDNYDQAKLACEVNNTSNEYYWYPVAVYVGTAALRSLRSVPPYTPSSGTTRQIRPRM